MFPLFFTRRIGNKELLKHISFKIGHWIVKVHMNERDLSTGSNRAYPLATITKLFVEHLSRDTIENVYKSRSSARFFHTISLNLFRSFIRSFHRKFSFQIAILTNGLRLSIDAISNTVSMQVRCFP